MAELYHELKRNTYKDPVGEHSHSYEDHYDDFVDYHLPLMRMHHAKLHGDGVASGLCVHGKVGEHSLTIKPGIAVDGLGQLIALSTEKPLPISSEHAGRTRLVVIKFHETPAGVQAPSLILLPEDNVNQEADVVLAVVTIDDDGKIKEPLETHKGKAVRHGIQQTVGELRIMHSDLQDDKVDDFIAGTIGPGENGGIHIDPKNGSVGIGTASPSNKLTVAFDDSKTHTHTMNIEGNPADSKHPEWHAQLLLQGTAESSEARLAFATTKPDGSRHGTAYIKTVVPENGGGILVFQTRAANFGELNEHLRITNAGNIGIGVAEPLSVLHVAKPSHINAIFDQTDSTEHLAVVVGSEGSGLRFSDSNRFFIGSQPYVDRNSMDGGKERFTILANGNIGIGTTKPTARLQIEGSSPANPGLAITTTSTNNGNSAIRICGRPNSERAIGFFTFRDGEYKRDWWFGMDNGPDMSQSLGFYHAGRKWVLQLRNDGSVRTKSGGVGEISSRDYKSDICDLTQDTAQTVLRSLSPVTFTLKDESQKGLEVGFIAEDSPALVKTLDGEAIVYSRITALLTKVVQNQQATIEDLQAKITKFESTLSTT